jgi:hypothetical protein
MLNTVTADPAAYGLTSAFVAELSSRLSSFRSDVAGHVAAQAMARSATAAKNASRRDLELALRSGRNVSKAAGATEAQMTSLGLPVSDGKVPANATVPSGSVDTSSRMRHIISWHDAESPGNRRRPRGVMGCEVWVKLGDTPPGGEKDCRFLTISSSPRYTAQLEPADVGETAHYMLRWRMRDGSTSGWSETVSATVTG